MPDLFSSIDFAPFVSEDTLVLAYSGGADSTFLGAALFRAGYKNIIVTHFDHALRQASKYDQIFCSQKAKEWQWKFETERWKTPQKSEEKARAARYEFLERVRKKHQAAAILVAHHADDQAETIFFQFLRGSGIKGLTGMPRWEEKRRLFRPLLPLTKAQILTALQEEKILFYEDETNFDAEAFDRNFLRLKVFPLLQERFPHFQKTLGKNAEFFQKVQDFLEAETENAFKSLKLQAAKEEQVFLRKEFFALPEIIRGEILKKLFMPKFISSEQIAEIQNFLVHAKSGKEKLLLGKRMRVYGERVFVEEK